MEFPNLGKHCTLDGCSQLDFLPYTCFYCKKIYCQDHYKLSDHSCPSLQDPNFDVRVPTCPICEKPVPGPRHEDPNIRVNRHIQNNCADAPKKPSNICHQKGCHTKILVPMKCPTCNQSFCIEHRLSVDHDCKSPPASSSGTFGIFSSNKGKLGTSTNNRAEMERQRIQRVQQNNQRQQELQRLEEKAKRGHLTEDEQIQLATLRSIYEKHNKNCTIS